MAQLPPKIPTITQNWPPFVPHQRMPSSKMANLGPTSANNTFTATAAAQNSQLPSSVDEFLHFSSARRGAHRRSASDSVAFLETTFLDEFRNSGTMMPAGSHGFDRLDDEQLMSMFSDDIVSSVAFPPPPPHSSSLSNRSSPASSSPSEQNSTNDEKPMALDGGLQNNQQLLQPKNEPGEVDSSCRNETPAPPFSASPSGGETIVDHKRVKRILANRQSAQRSRVRKLQYISELERSVTTLQSEVSALSPRVAFLDHQRLILNVDNSALKQRIAALAQDKIFKDAHQEALKKEIERLRQIYQQQNLQKMANTVNDNGRSLQAPPHSHPSQPLGCTEEQLLC